jgi:hypothetical protein
VYRQQLIDEPFAPLNQNYQKCHNKKSTVAVNQAGSSVGTVTLLAPIAIVFILLMLYAAQQCMGFTIKKTYTSGDKEAALQDLALRLLVVRDLQHKGRSNSYSGGPDSRDNSRGSEPMPNGATRSLNGINNSNSSNSSKTVLAQLVHELSQGMPEEEQQAMYHSEDPLPTSTTPKEPLTVNWGAVQGKITSAFSGGSEKDKKELANRRNQLLRQQQRLQRESETESERDTESGERGWCGGGSGVALELNALSTSGGHASTVGSPIH